MSFSARVRLKSELWTQAYLRRCAIDGAPVFVTRRGDPDAGAILIKISRLDGTAFVLVQTQDDDGEAAWRYGVAAEGASEAEVDSYIDRQAAYDRDIWVIEVEDRNGDPRLSEPILVDEL